jgi:hypothetical protein
MNDSKPWYLSRTNWVGIVTVAASLLSMAGYDVSAEDQSTLMDLIPAGLTAICGVATIYFRVAATKRIAPTA